MKPKIISLIFGMIFLMSIIPNISGEINLWTHIIVDNSTNEVNQHLFYSFEDTSARGIGKQKDIPIILQYNVQNLPYDLSGDGGYGQVDWCNLTINNFHNIYGTTFVAFQGFFGGELLNTTTETQSYLFDSGAYSGFITINMRDRDTLTADMFCHYNDTRDVYFQNILFGDLTTYIPSFECDSCEQFSLEELSYQTQKQENITQNELAIYERIQTAVDWNYQIWLIISWIIKIAFVFVAVGLIFASAYYFYKLIVDIGRDL